MWLQLRSPFPRRCTAFILPPPHHPARQQLRQTHHGLCVIHAATYFPTTSTNRAVLTPLTDAKCSSAGSSAGLKCSCSSPSNVPPPPEQQVHTIPVASAVCKPATSAPHSPSHSPSNSHSHSPSNSNSHSHKHNGEQGTGGSRWLHSSAPTSCCSTWLGDWQGATDAGTPTQGEASPAEGSSYTAAEMSRLKVFPNASTASKHG